MKNKRIRKQGILTTVCAVLAMSCALSQNVYAYDYQKTGAEQEGTVTIEAIPGGTVKNGYSLLNGYQLTYSITKNNWIAFDNSNGSEFFIGNQLSLSDGCHFVYKPDGTIWQQGALALGSIKDGFYVGNGEPDANGTVQISFPVDDLTQLPEYIAYTYQPAGGAYVHMTDSYGHNHHVWYYQTLRNVYPSNADVIDITAPVFSANVTAGGKTAISNGKTWGTKAVIKATALDDQSRPDGISFYKDGNEVHKCTNPANERTISGEYTVNANGSFQINAYDQLGNTGERKTVTVDCIDTSAPTISSFRQSESGYCKSLVLTVDAQDGQSGLDGSAYSFNGGTWTSENKLTVTQNGTYTVRVRDALGNEASKSITVSNIDRNAPNISAMTPKETDYCRENTITVTASDAESGLHAAAYSFNGGAWTSENKLVVTQDGTYTVRVRDALGNEASKSITISNIDLEEPQLLSRIENMGEAVSVGEKSWYKEKRIHIEAADEKSGLDRVVITDAEGTEICTKYPETGKKAELVFDTASVPMDTYRITAYDALGNSAGTEIIIDGVDNSPPVITAVLQTILDEDKIRISIWADDDENGSGLPKDAYSFDGGLTWQEENFKDIDKNGTYELAVRDNMGLQDQAEEVVTAIPDKKDKDKDTDQNDQDNDKNPDQGSGSPDDGNDQDDRNQNNGNPNDNSQDNDGDSSNKNQNNDNPNDNDQDNDGNPNDNSQDKHIDPADNSLINQTEEPSDANPNQGDENSDNHSDSNNNSSSVHDSNNSSINHTEPADSQRTANNDNQNKRKKRAPESKKSDLPDETETDSDKSVNENSIAESEDKNSEQYIKEEIDRVSEETMNDRQTEVQKLQDAAAAAEKEKKVKRIATIVLVSILILGLLGIGAYFLLTALYYSCILYAVDDHNHKKRLCRLPVKTLSEDWLVEVPDHELGTFGNGRYLLTFRTSFIKEGTSDYVVITIDRNRIREKLREEIEIKI